MAKSRIKYKETNDNKLVSIRLFTSNKGANYRVTLDLNEMTFHIKNVVNHRIYSGGENINSLQNLKRAARRRLKSLGCKLVTEVRSNV